MIVPQSGHLLLKTELGQIALEAGEIAMIPRGLKFQVEVLSNDASGYVLEVYGNHLVLPELGPIGSSGLANPRDFETPVAWYEEKAGNFRLINKYAGKFFEASLKHSPLDVVAWHGNYTPHKYDLKKFKYHKHSKFRPSRPIYIYCIDFAHRA